jgi:hypothetical protein
MYEDLPVLGRMSCADAAAKLRNVGEHEAADLLSLEGAQRVNDYSFLDFAGVRERGYQHTAHAFGHIPLNSGSDVLSIQSVGEMAADTSLRNSRIRITLDGLRAADYPGSGSHRVLFDFYAQNQVSRQVEHLHFNSTLRVREGESAAVVGYPVFIGLNVPAEGISLKCLTVNVKNDDDERLLAGLESDVFKNGLKLATSLQPAIAPLTGLATALTKSLAARNRNVPVQDFYLGLDFSQVATRARLREGSYIAVQVPERLSLIWNWTDWVYQPTNGRIVNRQEPDKLIPYNYVVLGVSRYEGK